MRLLGKGKSERDTNKTGTISESVIISRFLQLGYEVLAPIGGNLRYDLVIEDSEGELWRVQCKTGWIDEDGIAIKFATANQSPLSKTRGWHHYRGQCDYFAVYNEELDKVYLVPVDEVGTTQAHLRLKPTKNNQEKYVRWAKDYEL